MWDDFVVKSRRRNVISAIRLMETHGNICPIIARDKMAYYTINRPWIGYCPELTDRQNELNYFFKLFEEGDLMGMKILLHPLQIATDELKNNPHKKQINKILDGYKDPEKSNISSIMTRKNCARRMIEIACKGKYYSAIVDRFQQFQQGSTSNEIQLEIIKWVVENFNVTLEELEGSRNWAFINACTEGHLEVVKWLINRFNIPVTSYLKDDDYACVLTRSCIGGYLIVARWLADTFLFPEERNMTQEEMRRYGIYIYGFASSGGRLDALQWIIERFDLTPEIIKEKSILLYHLFGGGSIGEASDSRRLEAIKWIIDFADITADDIRNNDNVALYFACIEGRSEIVKWTVDRFGLTIEDFSHENYKAFVKLRKKRYFDLIEWLENKFNVDIGKIIKNRKKFWLRL